MTPPPLILASASPRRQALLRAGGVDFALRISGVDEAAFATGTPLAVAVKTAFAKAEAVAAQVQGEVPRETLILAADTIVVLGDEVFGKPSDRAEARSMLQRLAGRTHTVITGLALQQVQGEALLEAVSAVVTFNALSDDFVSEYLASGEADDKAGAYGIQGLGAHLVAAVEGDLTGVIGLPLGRLRDFYRQFTGRPLFTAQSPRQVALAAFADLTLLPTACLAGIPDSD
jgi:septum formation protein